MDLSKFLSADIYEMVQQLEGTDKQKRKESLEFLVELTQFRDLATHIETHIENQVYSTGQNLFFSLGNSPFIGIGSHYDVVDNSPGANDNASAVAVTIDVLRKIKENPLKNIGVRGFFFDEEESGLIGSRAYVKSYGINCLLGLYNMELVGSGDILALWSVDKKQDTVLLRTLESEAAKKGIQTIRFPKIIANTADHMSFRKKGLEDSFTITMITEADLKIAPLYYQALNQRLPPERLWEILEKAPVFKHYHKPSDKSEHINSETLQLVSDLLYLSICTVDKSYR